MGITEEIESVFRESLALVVLHGGMTGESEYQKGWLEGFFLSYKLMTGKSRYVLIEEVNAMIDGSGKGLKE